MRNFFVFVLLLSSFFISKAQEKIHKSSKTIIIATYQYSDNDRLKNIQPLAAILEKKIGYKVVSKSYPTVFSLITALNDKKVDLALISTFGYMLFDASNDATKMEAVAALEVRTGERDNYKTAFVVPWDSKITSFETIKEEAKNMKLELVAEGSTSGNLVPRLILTGAGIVNAETQFKSVNYGKTHQRTIEAVANGQADLAAMGSVDYFSFINNKENNQKVRLIKMSPEIPLGPVLLNKQLPKQLRAEIITVLLKLHQQNPEVLTSVKSGWSEARDADRFIAIKSSYYQPFKSGLGNPDELSRIIRQFTK
ncbi:phosphate/phosphite/phosphonate ABC transporter substrate-binding protein [Pedobacter sp. ASV1-7]|uniref:phosphate/phosphite/phosphonate ABC transporter substrate-binding protein n=1 Tax=Pedobacter sp. ASV1-7 TaxID=3145237 RepID=UPI0032E8716C